MPALILKETITAFGTSTACDFLSIRTGLPKVRIKDAMNKGALRVGRKKGGMRKLRRAKAELKTGDRIEFYYDEKILSISPPQAVCLSDEIHYSLWYKPPGLLAQGTAYGDHCSLTRQAELLFHPRAALPVHRLDREARGLMLLAHSTRAAARISDLFLNNRITKEYRTEVLGKIGEKGHRATMDLPLDGKEALTEIEVESFDPLNNTSLVRARIKTGRLHQIRRHLEMAGHPVIGDPKYGKGNKNAGGMRLSAVSLRFCCPFSEREMDFKLPSRLDFQGIVSLRADYP